MKLLPVEQLIPGDILGITLSPTTRLTSAGSRHFFLCTVDTLRTLLEFVQSISRYELKLWSITCCFGTLRNGIGHWKSHPQSPFCGSFWFHTGTTQHPLFGGSESEFMH